MKPLLPQFNVVLNGGFAVRPGVSPPTNSMFSNAVPNGVAKDPFKENFIVRVSRSQATPRTSPAVHFFPQILGWMCHMFTRAPGIWCWLVFFIHATKIYLSNIMIYLSNIPSNAHELLSSPIPCPPLDVPINDTSPNPICTACPGACMVASK